MNVNFTKRAKPWLLGMALGAGIGLMPSTDVDAQIGQNYLFSQSAGTYTPITGGTVIVNGALNSSLDSWVSPAITIPAVTVDGVTYTTAYVTSNGLLKLGGSAPSSILYTGISTNPSGGGVHIAPFNADLNKVSATAASEIRWEQVGNELVFQWQGWCRYGQTENFDFQVRINTVNSNIVFVYNLNSGPGTGTSYFPQVGIASANTANNYLNRMVGTTAGQNWDSSVPGTSNSSTMRFTGSSTEPRSFTSGQTYTFTYAPPSCFSPTNVVQSTVTTTSATVSWSAPATAPANGYEYYYSTSSTAPTATTTPSGTTPAGVTSVTINSLTPETQYYIWVRSVCGANDKSLWTMGSFYTGYCVPNGLTSNTSYYLSSISTTGANQNLNYTASSGVGYVNNTSTTLVTFPSNVINYNIAASSGTNYFYLWIDWNNDLDFDDAGETILATTSYASSNSGSLTIPVGTPPGNYRMRLANSWSGTITSCGPATYGNYVDFTLVVGAAPTCFSPTGVSASGVATNTAELNWTAPATLPANGYEYYYNTTGVAPTAATLATGSVGAGVTTASLTGLAAGTEYYAWVRSVCSSSDKSFWTGPVTFTTAPGCGSNFYDPGGPTAPYGNNVNSTTVITPTPGNVVTVTFSSFATESGWDFLKVYDGPDASSPALHTGSGFSGTLTGSSLPGPFTSTHPSGALTFVFTSDGSNTAAGWEATVTCSPAPTCIAPTALNVSGVTSTGATLNWTASVTTPGVGYDYYIDVANVAPTATTTPTGSVAATATSAVLSTLTPATTYHYWVRTNCATTDQSTWAYGGTFTTACAVFAAPFTENFENGALPNCWTNANNTNSTSTYLLWRFSGAMDYGVTGNGGKTSGTFAWVDASSPYNLGDSVLLVTPFIDLSTLNAPQVGFDWLKYHANTPTSAIYTTYDNNRLSLDINDGSGWVTLFADTSNLPTWRSEDIQIPATYYNQTVQFRLVVEKNISGNGYFYDNVAIDSFRVVEGPCVPPVVNLGNDTTICDGVTLTLDAGNHPATATYLWSTNATTATIQVATTGTYTVTVTDGGCSATDTINVTVAPLPVVDLGPDVANCDGQPVTLDAGGSASDSYLWNDNSTAQTLVATTSGTYSVTVTNAAGCSAADTVEVVIGEVPSVDGITVSGTSPSFNFEAQNPQNADNYSWDFGDNATGTGAIVSHNYTPQANDVTYTVTLVVSNDCGADTVQTSVIVKGTVGVKDLHLNGEVLKMFPNPAAHTVTLTNESNYTMKQVVITNVLGQQVMVLPVSGNTEKIDVAHLTPGLYHVSIEFNEGVVTRKLEILK